jgi:hypothetical protein
VRYTLDVFVNPVSDINYADLARLLFFMPRFFVISGFADTPFGVQVSIALISFNFQVRIARRWLAGGLNEQVVIEPVTQMGASKTPVRCMRPLPLVGRGTLSREIQTGQKLPMQPVIGPSPGSVAPIGILSQSWPRAL